MVVLGQMSLRLHSLYLSFVNNTGSISLPEGLTPFMESVVQSHSNLLGLFIIIVGVVCTCLFAVIIEQNRQVHSLFTSITFGQLLYFLGINAHNMRQKTTLQAAWGIVFSRESLNLIDGFCNPMKPYENSFVERSLLTTAFALGIILLISSTTLIYVMSQFHHESSSIQISAKQWSWGTKAISPISSNLLGFQSLNDFIILTKVENDISTHINNICKSKGVHLPLLYRSVDSIELINQSLNTKVIDTNLVFQGGYRTSWLISASRQFPISV